MRYEYHTLKFATSKWFLSGGDFDEHAFTDQLNSLGAEGWKLVSVFDTNILHGRSRDVVAVLRRQIP